MTPFSPFPPSSLSFVFKHWRIADKIKPFNQVHLIGVSVNTVRAWLAVLEATYQVIILRPYYSNINKRLVKSPKVYFTDVGTLCYLTGLRDVDHLAAGPMSGAIFETFVVSQVYKRLLNRGIEPSVYFWRTATGIEVDLLVDDQGRLYPIEVKATATPRPPMAASIQSLRKDLCEVIVEPPLPKVRGFLLHHCSNEQLHKRLRPTFRRP